MGSGAVPQRKDILQTGLRAGHSKASRADLNFTNALREGLFLLALARPGTNVTAPRRTMAECFATRAGAQGAIRRGALQARVD